jgi:hypothetical protein
MWWSHQYMLMLWVGCMVMGAVYLFGLWDGNGSPAFVVGQIVLGAVGTTRELHLKKHGFHG